MTLWDGGIDYSPYAGAAPAPQAGTYINNTADDLYTSYVKTWKAWTPTVTNLTVGNGTTTARLYAISGRAHFLWSFTVGSTSALAASPVTVRCTDWDQDSLSMPGTAGAFDTSAGLWYPIAAHCTSGVGELTLRATSTFPFTWATGDVLSVSWTFPRYPATFSVGET